MEAVLLHASYRAVQAGGKDSAAKPAFGQISFVRLSRRHGETEVGHEVKFALRCDPPELAKEAMTALAELGLVAVDVEVDVNQFGQNSYAKVSGIKALGVFEDVVEVGPSGFRRREPKSPVPAEPKRPVAEPTRAAVVAVR